MEQSVLYLECNSGISGDMTAAALLDLGADQQVLLDALASLPLTGYSIEIKEVYKSGLRACDFNVILEHDNHDHDMEYLHGHAHDAENAPHGHPHEHIHEAVSSHAHPYEHVHEAAVPHDHRLHTPDAKPGAHEHHYEATVPHENHHPHESRNLQDITEIINAGKLTDRARALALHIFRILAEAEASVHGKSVEEIHFHEVGAVDSIVDIVAVAVCLDNLSTARVVVSPLTEGTGQIRCQHGLIPVPVPAVTAIAAQNGLTLKLTDIEGELVTPTGAAIAAALLPGTLDSDASRPDIPQSHALQSDVSQPDMPQSHAPQSDMPQSHALQSDASKPGILDSGNSRPGVSESAPSHSGHSPSAAGLPAAFQIRKVGLGAGKRNYATAGVLRAMLLEPQDDPGDRESLSGSGSPDPDSALPSSPDKDTDSGDTILSLETNIDDCTGEALAFTMQELLDHGALDVFYVPIYMKKNRPACLLRVLCRADSRELLESIIFKNTTTIGIRVQEMQRTKLPRQILSLETPWGKADVKCCTYDGETYYYPENDSVSELARKNRIGFSEMYHLLQTHAESIGK